MAHPVKCACCGETFDRDKIQAVKYNGRRYAHQTCFPQGEIVPLPIKEIDEDLEKLFEYTKQLLGEEYNHARVKKQVKDFKEEYGYSYSGMLKSLVYFYEVKGNSKEKANGGIGIVPFVYRDAYNYYFKLRSNLRKHTFLRNYLIWMMKRSNPWQQKSILIILLLFK